MTMYIRNVLALLLAVISWTLASEPIIFPLNKWAISSSRSLTSPYNTGKVLSQPSYKEGDEWYAVNTPSTVLAGLLQNDVYKDPFYGLNLQNISTDQFECTWWYRVVLNLTANTNNVTLTFKGINYAANVWINGIQIATNSTVVGTFRRFDFDITQYVSSDKTTAIALEVSPPNDTVFGDNNTSVDLALTFVDWAPYPPDSNMGLWRDAFVTLTGAVSIRNPMVRTELSSDGVTADLLVLVDVISHSSSSSPSPSPSSSSLSSSPPPSGVLQVVLTPPAYSKASAITLKQAVKFIASQATQQVIFSSATYSQLKFSIVDPENTMWWPWQMGAPNMFSLIATFITDDGDTSDSLTAKFGVRQMTSELDKSGHRLYSVNNKPILIRGGGWAPELFQRVDLVKQENEFKYVRHMGLNTIRLEGHLAQDSFYHMADEYGILLMPGWSCCDAWQHWKSWGPAQHVIASESLRSQVQRLRIRPSILVFLYSSDELPPVAVEKEYLAVFTQEKWPNPILSTASALTSSITGPSGVKMSGPYSWVPPNYWLVDKNQYGGAYGFLTEGGPGEAPLTFESLSRTIPSDHMWPMDEYWNYHCGNSEGEFRDLHYFTGPLYARYGTATSAVDYLKKSQVAVYEGIRAMFEGYSRNKYTSSTGLIQWMLNNPWPEMIWHLYDFYLTPPAAYFAAKKGCESLHVQYSYDDNSIWIVNSLYTPRTTPVSVSVEVYNVDGSVVYKNQLVQVSRVGPDTSLHVFTLPKFANISSTSYFVFLYLYDTASLSLITDNTYWLSTKQDVLDWKKSTFYNTPCTAYADFTPLQHLPTVNLDVNYTKRTLNNDIVLDIKLSNPSASAIAFFTHLRVTNGTVGVDIAPIFWTDNYVTISPLKSRLLSVQFDSSGVSTPVLIVEVFNGIKSQFIEIA